MNKTLTVKDVKQALCVGCPDYDSDPGIHLHIIKRANKTYFLKIYKNKLLDFEKEKLNYSIVKRIKVLNSNIPKRYATFKTQNIGCIVYEFINTPTLDVLIHKNANCFSTILDCINTMPLFLKLPAMITADHKLYTITNRYLNNSQLKEINNITQDIVHKINSMSKDIFGKLVYFDRNPRNILISREKIIHVDFEVMKNVSPLFDLAKLLRNGKGFHKLANCNNYPREKCLKIARTCRTLNPAKEFVTLNYFLDKYSVKANKIEIAQLAFNLSCLIIHLFYFFVYSERYLTKEKEELKNRLAYHYYEIFEMIKNLEKNMQKKDVVKLKKILKLVKQANAIPLKAR